jgi:cell wall-associated NlpC family hydrolase
MKHRFPVTTMLLLFLVSFLSGCGLHRGGWFYRMDERSRIVRTAERYRGVPYRYGGSTPQGFDCSCYVMYVYQQNGILLPRSVGGQYNAGMPIRLGRAEPGDLVFFRTSRKRRFSHVGIYMGDRQFIHAPRTGKKVSYADMRKPYWKKRYIGAVTFMRKNMM